MPGRGYRKPKAILKCPDCPYTTERVGVFEDHRRVHTGDRPFKCDICGKGFTQKSNLGQHLKVHGAGKQHQFKCDLCDFVTKWKTSLHIHERMHSGEKPYKCTQCDKAFSQSTHRRTHMKESHQEERKFQCEICSKCFKRQDHLDRHMLFHNNARNHECSVCKKRFNDRRSLKVHGMIHQGEATKIYTCDLCPYKARYRQALKIHYRFHSGVRPYTCDYCTKTFVTSQTKKLHMILVHKGFASKIFACEQCTYTTPYKPHLKNHINKVHLGIKDRRHIQCLYCNKVYSNHGSLITHKRKKHTRQFQKELKAKREKKVLFMKACAEKVKCSVGEDLKLDTLTSVSQNEEKDVQEYLDSIQAYLKNRMDQVSVPNYTAVKTTDLKSEPTAESQSRNTRGPRASRHKTKAKSENKPEAVSVKISKLVPRVELERLTIDGTGLDTREQYKLCGNKLTNAGPRKKKKKQKRGETESQTSRPITKLVKNKPPVKKLPKKLPHIVLRLPAVKKSPKLKVKPKQQVGQRKTKCDVSNRANCSKPSKKSHRRVSQPPIVYESDSNYSVPVCTGTSIGKYQVIGTVVSRNVPSSLSKTAATSKQWQPHVIKGSLGAPEPKGASQIVLSPSTSHSHSNPMREFDSLRALASSYVEASDGIIPLTPSLTSVCPIKTESIDAVVPMSLISHSDAVQRGPYTGHQDSLDHKSDIQLNVCNIYNKPD